MNIKEAETGKISKAWTHAIDDVREKLNIYRKKRGKKLPKYITTHEYPIFDNTVPKMKFKNTREGANARTAQRLVLEREKGGDLKQDLEKFPVEEQTYTQIKPKYRVGDLVNVLLEDPRTMLDKKQPTKIYRMGDLRLEKKKRKIIKVLYYSGNVPYRYLI